VALVSIVWVLFGYSIAFSDVNMTAGEYNLNSFFGSLHNGGRCTRCMNSVDP
jgi:ammonia channel protein AmtB